MDEWSGLEPYDDEPEADLPEVKQSNGFLSSSVVQKIEKAKLYQMLLTCDFFEDDAAIDGMVEEVTREVRSFVHFKLECLLGDRKSDKEFGESAPQASLPWNDQQIEALTGLADRLLKGASVLSPKPSGVKKVSSRRTPEAERPKVQTQKLTAEAKPKLKAKLAAEEKEKPLKQMTEEERVREHFKKYQLKNNPERLPMPSQQHMDDLNAQLADQNSRGAFGAGSSKLSGALGQVMTRLTR